MITKDTTFLGEVAFNPCRLTLFVEPTPHAQSMIPRFAVRGILRGTPYSNLVFEPSAPEPPRRRQRLSIAMKVPGLAGHLSVTGRGNLRYTLDFDPDQFDLADMGVVVEDDGSTIADWLECHDHIVRQARSLQHHRRTTAATATDNEEEEEEAA